MLNYIELDRENVYVTNVVKIGLNRTPTDEELASWKPSLLKEIEEIKPKVILALGACSAKTLLGWQKFTNMTTVRGRIFLLPDRTKIVCSWHPAYLLRKSGDKKTNEQVKEDLKLVQKLLNE